MNDEVLLEVENGVALLTLNRPHRSNAFTLDMGERYFDLLDEVSERDDVRAIVLTGSGRAFCVGADIDQLPALAAAPPLSRPSTYPLQIPKPIIAAINGSCAGMGFVFAATADIQFASAGTKFTTAFSRRGLVAEHGLSWLLPRLVGPSTALDLLLSARVFLAEEALAIGLVTRVIAPEALLEEALAYATDLATYCSPESMSVIKRQVWTHLEMDLTTALAESNILMRASFERPDFREGIASYLEGRTPGFPGLAISMRNDSLGG